MFENLQAKSVLPPTTFKLVILDQKDKSKIADLYEDTNEQKVKMFADEAHRWNFHYAFERHTANPHNNNIFVEGYYCEGGLRKHYHYHEIKPNKAKYVVTAFIDDVNNIQHETDNIEIVQNFCNFFDLVFVEAYHPNGKLFYKLYWHRVAKEAEAA